MIQCTVCNEYIDEDDILFGEVTETDGEYWHVECYHEYFGELVEA